MSDPIAALTPRFLSRAEAARYLGVSTDTFNDEVAAGIWPQGRPRGQKGGKLTWDRALLDRVADGLAGTADAPMPASQIDEAAAALERRIDGQAQRQRDQRRHKAAA